MNREVSYENMKALEEVNDILTARVAELEHEIKRRDLEREIENLESFEPGFLDPCQAMALSSQIADLRRALFAHNLPAQPKG
ncbi:hypothetical protein [Mesoterricola silvestris]|uniref:Uncharacterized protein n=1 Tax=Mesoterricola silvestris TaxID=2927979 RepID=A0AA48GQX5_9BACT|nr:hypothetical protein [Mesoterricola silvestris]BDU72377.1 hypothetical protein METEAL_15510 [Mesoterricola silvestris]